MNQPLRCLDDNNADPVTRSRRRSRCVVMEAMESRLLLSGAPILPADASATLVAVVAGSEVPAAVVAGRPINRAVIVNVINQALMTRVSGFPLVQVFASADGVVDDSSVLLATKKEHVNLRPGFSVFERLQIKTTPAALPAGSYTLLAEVTDPFGNSSSAIFGPVVQVADPFVSLQNLSIGPVTPRKIKPGKAGNVAVTVANQGNINSTGPATIDLFLSIDGQAEPAPLATLTPTIKIQAGHNHVFHLHFVVPANQAPGTYAPFVSISQDGSGTSGMGNEPFAIEV